MPNALTFIIGADAQPFAREMRQMDDLALRSARSISSRVAEGSHGSYSGIIRESITIVREAIEGRGIGRIIGSGSLLGQYLYRLATGAKSAAKEAEEAAIKFNLMALRQTDAAKAAIEHASALDKEWTSNTAATEADLTAAIAARGQATAETEAAVALDKKAASAARAAEIEEAEALVAKQSSTATQTFLTKVLSLIPAIAGLTIGAVIAHNLYRGFQMIAAGAELAANKIKGVTDRLEAMRHVSRELDDQMSDFTKWRQKLNESDDSIGDPLRERLKAMREEFELRQKLAALQGQTPKQRAQAELDEQKSELKVLKNARDDAQFRVDAAVGITDAAQKNLQEKGPQRKQAEISEKDADQKAKILAAVMSEFGEQTDKNRLIAAWKSNTLPQLFRAFSDITSRDDLLVNTTVDGKKISMSLADARAGFNASQKNADINRKVVKSSEDALSEAKSKEEKARQDSKRINAQFAEAQNSYDLNKKYDPEIAALERNKRGSDYHQQLNELQKIGGMYSMPMPNEVAATARKTEEHTRRTAVAVEKIAGKNTPHGAAHF